MKTIQQIKTDVMLFLSYRLHHKYMVTEGMNHSDVFSINRNDYSCEYEIKTNKADLDKELRAMCRTDVKDWHRADNKSCKHHYYRMGKAKIEENESTWFGGLIPFRFIVPNKFYFVIPQNLFSYLSGKLLNLPYGIMTWRDDGDYDYWTMEVKKQADFLHKEKADHTLKERMLDRAVNELVELRGKFYYKRE